MDWAELLTQLIELVKSTAPMVWAMAQQQVLADVAECAATAIVLLLSLVPLRKGLKWTHNVKEGDWLYLDRGGLRGTFLFMYYAAVTLAGCCSIMIIKRLISPDYYALKILMGLATGQ